MPEVLIVLAALLGIVYYVCQPFFGPSPAAAAAPPDHRPEAERVLEESLANLQYDFHAGKISAGDYEEIRAEMEDRLARSRPAAEAPAAPQKARGKGRAKRSG